MLPQSRSMLTRFSLQHLPIRVRLPLVFACIVGMMLFGSVMAVWHFNRVGSRIRNVSAAELRLTSILQMNNSLLGLMSRLYRAADTGDAVLFETRATRELAAFQADTAAGRRFLSTQQPENGLEAVLADNFKAILDELPKRVQTFIELAQNNDWPALHARLNNQIDQTDEVADALMQEIDKELSNSRTNLSDDIEQTERRAMETVALTGLLSIIASALLAFVLIGGIARPLKALEAGTRALARGEFSEPVPVMGTDELATVAVAFNTAARELNELYTRVRRSEAQLRLITDALPVLISYFDRDQRYCFTNRPHEEWFGTKASELIGKPMQEVFGASAYAAIQGSVERALSGETAVHQTSMSFNGHAERFVRAAMIPDLDETGGVRGMVGLVEDITADKLAEAALRKSGEYLQQLLTSEQQSRNAAELSNRIGRMLSAELDSARLIQSVADITTRLLGAQTGAFFQKTSAQSDACLIPVTVAAAAPSSREAFESVTLNAGALDFSGITRCDDASGKGWFTSGAPVKSCLIGPIVSRSHEVLGVLVFGHREAGRFTEHHEEIVAGVCAQAAIALDNARLFGQVTLANRALQESNKALQRANEDLNQFAYSVSHDLQEPLRNVKLYTELLKRRYQSQFDANADEYMSYIVESAARMIDLLQDLLAYMKASGDQGNTKVAPRPLGPVLDKVLASLQTAIQSNDAVVTVGELPAVGIEDVHLHQLFQNLIGNALKYRGPAPPVVHVSARRDGDFWVFSVKDNGIGIHPQYAKQVFGVFKRLHDRNTYPGTGIGLAICNKIVERYGGRIWVESEEGKGADFRFTVPA